MNEEPNLAPTALARLRELGGDPFVHQMLGLFLDLTREKLAAAHAASLAGDLTEVRKAVHPLRSSSGSVGATVMLDLATRIEALARDGPPGEIPALLQKLEAAFAQLEPRIVEERETANH